VFCNYEEIEIDYLKDKNVELKKEKIPRFRNRELEGGGLYRPHIFLEDKKVI